VGKKEQQLNRLQGKVAVITGGSSGMGFATAEQFVTEGAYVLHHWEAREGTRCCRYENRKEYRSRPGDVSKMFPIWRTFDRLYAKIAEDKGRIDVVFANAGIGNQRAPLGSITEEQIDRTFNVNVRGLIVHVAVNIWSAARLQGDSETERIDFNPVITEWAATMPDPSTRLTSQQRIGWSIFSLRRQSATLQP
jgi:NAD(P)-dependent dehydrogenase (short-subunit alcohol dehydrogenase family)